MNKTELIIIGGFLGTGKTTSILEIAKILINQGKKVGIVTNDQGSNLVDTQYLSKQGLSVLEVTEGCFCCNFEEFIEKIKIIAEKDMPDVVLAEPVGSCTDLIATILKPIDLNFKDIITLRPLSVLVDPKRIKRLMIEKNSPFHSEVNYLFEKQLEEADIIVLNKADKISEIERVEILNFLDNHYRGVPIITISALEGLNMDKWLGLITEMGQSNNRVLDIDYDIYAYAEARLGWLNTSIGIDFHDMININIFIKELMENIKDNLRNINREIAHLKIYGVSEVDWVKASLISIYEDIELNQIAELSDSKWNIIINARIDIEPKVLKDTVENALKSTVNNENTKIDTFSFQYFKPSRPNPKYRIK